MKVKLAQALKHGWQIHNHSMHGIWLNLRGDYILFIYWDGEIQSRGSRSALNLPLVARNM